MAELDRAAALAGSAALPAVLEPLLVAAWQFALHVALARSLAPAVYGAFSLGQALYLASAVFHTALLSEPMLVFSQRQFADRLEPYFGALVCGLLALGLAAALALGAVGALLWWLAEPGAGALLAFAAACPLLLALPLLRRLCCVLGKPWCALQASALGGALGLGSVAALRALGELSDWSAVLALGAAAGASLGWFARALPLAPARPSRALLREVARAHWRFGRWTLLSGFATWAPWNLHFALLAWWRTLEDVAAARALYNIALPMIHWVTAVHVPAVTQLAWLLDRGETRRVRRTALGLGALLALVSALYALGIVCFGPALLAWLYRGAYQQFYALAPCVAAAYVPFAAVKLVELVQLAAVRTDRALLAWLPYVALALALGSAAAAVRGVAGLVLGNLVAAAVGAALALALLARWRTWADRGDPRDAAPVQAS